MVVSAWLSSLSFLDLGNELGDLGASKPHVEELGVFERNKASGEILVSSLSVSISYLGDKSLETFSPPCNIQVRSSSLFIKIS